MNATPMPHSGPSGLLENGLLTTWEEIYQGAGKLRLEIEKIEGGAVGVETASGSQLVQCLIACRGLNRDLAIVPPGISSAALAGIGAISLIQGSSSSIQEMRVCSFPATSSSLTHGVPSESGLWIFTSGTLGHARPIRRPWHEFVRGAEWHPSRQSERWAIGYAPFTFAGITASCQALRRAGTIHYVAPGDLVSDTDCRLGFDIAVGTPSFWRMAVVHALRTGSAIPLLRVVSIGGEAVDELLIKDIRTVLRPGRIKQLFGTTESGVVIDVNDEQAGLPADILGKRNANGKALDVRNGMLLVSIHEDEPFLPTGDHAVIAGSRVIITGRVGMSINVGGIKVNPLAVAQVIQQHPDVIAARAYAVRSPILGSVVGVEVVAHITHDAESTASAIRQFARSKLAPYERPMVVTIVEELSIEASGKLGIHE